MKKYLRYLKDGYVIPFNEVLDDHPDYEVFETDGDPNDPSFLSPGDLERLKQATATPKGKAK